MQIKFAAKTDVGIVRTNNEDNFQVASDLASGKMQWVNNEVVELGDKGALLVVADGMGGMNAGEVASELAIQTIREHFSSDRLTDAVTKDRFSIEKHMNEAIVAADAKIKAEAKCRPETRGMGTTIVIGWIYGSKLYISWCGDSRAYVFNPAAGLHQISKDHSYVQSLVDKGAISREDAFDFPESNIITRCLSDSTTKAVPESLLHPYDLCDGDIVMLCTDGLNGMLRDPEMEAIIRADGDDLDRMADDLIKGACDAEGSDNITICLCLVTGMGRTCNPKAFDEYEERLNGRKGASAINRMDTASGQMEDMKNELKRRFKFWPFSLGFLVVAIVAVFCIWFFWARDTESDGDDAIAGQDMQEQTDQNLAVDADTQLDAVPGAGEESTALAEDGKTERGSSNSISNALGNLSNSLSQQNGQAENIEGAQQSDPSPGLTLLPGQGNPATDAPSTSTPPAAQESQELTPVPTPPASAE